MDRHCPSVALACCPTDCSHIWRGLEHLARCGPGCRQEAFAAQAPAGRSTDHRLASFKGRRIPLGQIRIQFGCDVQGAGSRGDSKAMGPGSPRSHRTFARTRGWATGNGEILARRGVHSGSRKNKLKKVLWTHVEDRRQMGISGR